ncbi:MAG: cysteine--tRNA ligase [Actinomycetota bacterium]
MLVVADTLTNSRKEIAPLDPGKIGMYSCGPTVYRYAHIGNLRTFLAADVLRRALEYRGLEVTQVQNITDIGHLTDEMFDRGEDKMLMAARLEQKSPAEIAAYYTEAYLADAAKVGILPAARYPRASRHVPQMIELVAKLLESGHAYEREGTVYYDVTSFPGYGKLSGNSLESLRPGHRHEGVDYAKRHHFDFVLWKAAGPRRLVKWDSPWGNGYPGWHIECSAMSLHYLGERFDVHTGGVDLTFPHHECEIAQSETVTGHQVVSTWVHAEHLLAEGRKMSKSAGNFYGLRELEERGHSPLAFRFLSLQSRYRTQLNFTWDALAASETALHRLRSKVAEWSCLPGPSTGPSGRDEADYEARFLAAVEDDLNLPAALSLISRLDADPDLQPAAKARLVAGWDRILGLDLTPVSVSLPEGAQNLIHRREEARRARDFAAADALRAQLADLGVEVTDTPSGTTWHLAHPPAAGRP